MSRKETQNNHPESDDSQETRPLPTVPTPDTGEQRLVVPLIEETLDVDKNWVKAGEVVIRRRVESRTETVPVELAHEEVEIERTPVNRLLAQGETLSPRQEGDWTVIPVVEEELVVTKRLVVREEVRIRKKRTVRKEQVSDTVRSQHLAIDTSGKLESVDEQI